MSLTVGQCIPGKFNFQNVEPIWVDKTAQDAPLASASCSSQLSYTASYVVAMHSALCEQSPGQSAGKTELFGISKEVSDITRVFCNSHISVYRQCESAWRTFNEMIIRRLRLATIFSFLGVDTLWIDGPIWRRLPKKMSDLCCPADIGII